MRVGLIIGLATALTLTITGADAQTARPGALSSKDEARKLADEGQRLFDAGNYRGALEKLRAAEVKFSAPTIRVAQAEAHEKLGELRRALALYGQVASEEVAPNAPAEYLEAQREATLAVSRLTAAIPKVTLVLVGSPPPLLSISLDGASLEGSVWERPVQVDPGPHTLVIEVSGRPPETRALDLKEGQSARIEVRGDTGRTSSAPDSGGAATRSYAAPLVAFGIGLGGLGVGVVSGALTLEKMQSFRAACGPELVCPSSYAGEIDAARWTGHVSTVGFALAAAGGAIGAALLFWPIARVNVAVGPSGVELTGRF